MSLSRYMHPRNRYKNNRPDFKKLALDHEGFRKVCSLVLCQLSLYMSCYIDLWIFCNVNVFFPSSTSPEYYFVKMSFKFSLGYCRIVVYMLGDNHIWQQLVFTVIPISVTAWYSVVYGRWRSWAECANFTIYLQLSFDYQLCSLSAQT